MRPLRTSKETCCRCVISWDALNFATTLLSTYKKQCKAHKKSGDFINNMQKDSYCNLTSFQVITKKTPLIFRIREILFYLNLKVCIKFL